VTPPAGGVTRPWRGERLGGGRPPAEEVGGFLVDHDRGGVGVRRRDRGHDRGVRDAQPLQAADAELRVDHGEVVDPHAAGARGVVEAAHAGADERPQRVGPGRPGADDDVVVAPRRAPAAGRGGRRAHGQQAKPAEAAPLEAGHTLTSFVGFPALPRRVDRSWPGRPGPAATDAGPETGLLTRPIDIPVLSWLYQRLFGEPLTLLNLVTLVAAIPLTVMWRVVEGEWPSQSLALVAAEGVGGVPPIYARLLTFFGGLNAIVAGIAAASADFLKEPPFFVGVLATLCGLVTTGVTIPLAATGNAVPSPVDWAAWSAVLGCGMVTFIGALPGVETGTPGKAPFDILISVLTAVMGATQLAAFVVDWIDQRKHDFETDWSFGLNVASVLPLLLKPLKLFGAYGRLTVAIADGLVGVIVGVLLIGHSLPCRPSLPDGHR
jgi:hypothetical protein